MKNEFNELISIVMPAYNSEKYIADAIDSIIRQTYENWELIIIDDGSIDQTTDIVSKYICSNEKIKLYSNDNNIGVSRSRNKGIEIAKGNWIAFLDSDDLWKFDKLEKQIELIVKKDAEFVFTGASYINENGKKFNGEFSVPETVNFSKLKRQNVISCSSVIIKKIHIKKFKMANDNIHEDYAVWLKILRSGVIAQGISEPLLIYRISLTSKSGNKFKSFKMTYGVFRYIGNSSLKSIYYTFFHIILSFQKYHRILFKRY